MHAPKPIHNRRQEYAGLKESLLTNTRRAGATLGVYLLVTVSGSVSESTGEGERCTFT